MKVEQVGEYTVESDGRTVWVNGPPDGFMVARFGPRGTECGSHVRPGDTTAVTWKLWQNEVALTFGVKVSDDHRPERLGGPR